MKWMLAGRLGGGGGGSPAHLGAAREEFTNERSKLGEKPNVMVTRDQEA